MVLVHLLKIFILDDFYSFLDFWFSHLPQKFLRKAIDLIYSLDAEIKIKSHFKNFFKPFYGKKGFILVILSLPFRILIITLGSLFYSLILLTALFFILFFTILPIGLLLVFLNSLKIINYGVLFRK